MIEEIAIRNLGVIGDAILPLGPGFTALTGETGAGKTMVVTALGLLLGARGDSGSVRSGAEQAVIEGRWQIDAYGPVAERARDAGGEGAYWRDESVRSTPARSRKTLRRPAVRRWVGDPTPAETLSRSSVFPACGAAFVMAIRALTASPR